MDPRRSLADLGRGRDRCRNASNTANRLKAAAFPVAKTVDGFDVGSSSVSQATFDYLSSLEWIRVQQNLAITAPPGTGKSHLLVGCGHAAVNAGFKIRYFTAPTSSRSSTGAWPTTPSATSSTPYCGQIYWSSTKSASYPWMTGALNCCSA